MFGFLRISAWIPIPRYPYPRYYLSEISEIPSDMVLTFSEKNGILIVDFRKQGLAMDRARLLKHGEVAIHIVRVDP